MEMSAFTIDDFTGGITDNYVDAASNKYQVADNFFVTQNKKLLVRWGSSIFDSTHHTVLASGNPRIGGLINYDSDNVLFVQIAQNIYYNPSSWQSLLGPSSNACFNTAASTNYMSYAEWAKHLFLVNDAYSYPSKIWKDDAGVVKLRTAGLPSLDLFAAINLANNIKAKYNQHRTDVTANRHPTDDDTNVVSAANASDLTTLITLVTELLVDFDAHATDASLGAGWAFHGATATTNERPLNTTAPRTLTECLARLDDLRTHYIAHEADAAPHTAIGTQVADQITVSRNFTIAPSAGGTNYIYAFVYVYKYTVGNLVYEDFGPVKQVAFTKAAAITAVSPATVSNFAPFQIANGAIFNWETSGSGQIVIRVYRTINNGSTFYWVEDLADTTATNTRVGFISNSAISGATTYVDGSTDAVLLANNRQLYINGGVPDNDQPPPAKFVHITDNFAYYGNIKEGSDVFPNRLRQSFRSDPDSCPGSFFLDLEDEIVGLSSVNSIPIVFCKRFAYRIDGSFDDLGRGGMQAIKIVDAPGCLGHQSIVQTSVGVFYAGIDGFYWTDGFRVQKISDEWNTTYRGITSTETKQKRIYGTYDAENRRVWWGIQYDSTSSDNDRFLILDLRWGVRPDSCFTTASNGVDFAPTACVFFNKKLVRGDRRGYLFSHDSTVSTDLKVDIASAPSAWVKKTIQYQYKSVASDLGDGQNKKIISRITLEGKNEGRVSFLVRSINDDGRSIRDLREFRFRSSNEWGDELLFWGDSSVLWGLDGEMSMWGRFPAQQFRCQRKQIEIVNSNTIVVNSDTIGLATLDGTANTATLVNAGTTWPTDSVDYYLSLETDSYAKQYLVTAINVGKTVLTLQDTQGTLPTGNVKWQLKGYIKGEILHLNKYTLHVTSFSKTQEHFTGRVGENA